MSTAGSPMLLAALEYAARGLVMFPVSGKKPLTSHGFHDATTDDLIIRGWWSRWPDASIGLPTGARNGVVVVDVDDEEAFEAFQREYGRLPAARLVVLTPRGGRHLYYRHPGGGHVVKTRAPIREGFVGLDVRGDGGYVVVPPTPGYLFELDGDAATLVDVARLGPAPAVLLEEPTPARSSPASSAPIREGERNAYLTSLLGAARRRGATVSELEALGLTANAERCTPPLPESEVRAIAASVGRYPPATEPDGSDIHSSALGIGSANRNRLRFQTASELAARTPATADFLLDGYLPRGGLVELVGKVKAAGKTTLALGWSAAVLRGEPFAGRTTQRTRVVYLTEQPDSSYREALGRAGLLDADGLTVLSWHDAIGVPWPEVVARTVEECRAREAGLLVADTISQWAGIRGDAENNAGDALEAVRPLQEAAALHRLSVLAIRHARKGAGDVGEDGRGSSAFAGAVDVVLSLRRPENSTDATVRVLHALSRFSATPETLALQLTPHGYIALGDEAAYATEIAKRQIRDGAPRTEEHAVTANELLDAAKVRRTTGLGAMAALHDLGVLRRVGAGKKGDPFRYYAPGPEKVFADPTPIAEERKGGASDARSPSGTENGDPMLRAAAELGLVEGEE